MKLRQFVLKTVTTLALLGLPSCANQSACVKARYGPSSGSAGASQDAASSADLQRAVDAVYPALVRIHVVFEEGREGDRKSTRLNSSH